MPSRDCRPYVAHTPQRISGVRSKRAVTTPWHRNEAFLGLHSTNMRKRRNGLHCYVVPNPTERKCSHYFIGSARRPRCFQKKSAPEHGFDYGRNKKAWMTILLFLNEWFKRSNSYIEAIVGRRVLLILDYLSGHGKAGSILEISSARVELIPPNTNSKPQPIDAGVISFLKRRYRTAQNNRALDVSSEINTDIYAIGLLTAMKYLKRIWHSMPANVIDSC